jgi:signal transduction histidine kinase
VLLSAQKEHLLNTLSEELRSPLSNIQMALKMMESSTSEEQRDRYLRVLKEECSREIALLNQLDLLK